LATGTPLIAQMAVKQNITANILFASTRCIGDKVYGNMLLGISDDDVVVNRAITYLQGIDNIVVEELGDNV